MADYLFRQTGKKFGQSLISRALKKNNITYKKVTSHYSEQKSHMQTIREFVDLFDLPTIPWEHILALDECGFSLNESPADVLMLEKAYELLIGNQEKEVAITP